MGNCAIRVVTSKKTQMFAIFKYSLIIILIFFFNSFCSRRFVEEEMEILGLLYQTNNYGISETRYFIRANDSIFTDFFVSEEEYNFLSTLFFKLLLSNSDSVKIYTQKYPSDSNKHYYVFKYGVIDRKFVIKNYINVSFIINHKGLIGIYNVNKKHIFTRWDSGPPNSQNRNFSKKLIKYLLLELKNGEYVGKHYVKNSVKLKNLYWKSSAQVLWKWFKKHESLLFEYDTNKKLVNQMLNREFYRFNPDVKWLIGPINNEGKRILSIRCDKYIEERLAKRLPDLNYWTIVFKN